MQIDKLNTGPLYHINCIKIQFCNPEFSNNLKFKIHLDILKKIIVL